MPRSVGAPIPTLSHLLINDDKDWEGRNITNLQGLEIIADPTLDQYAPTRGWVLKAQGEPYRAELGLQWSSLGTPFGAEPARYITYLGYGHLIGWSDTNIWSSADGAHTWATTGNINPTRAFFNGVGMGNGIAILGDSVNHVWRSTDWGVNWADLGALLVGGSRSACYCGHGIALLGQSTGHIGRTTDYGANWTDLGNLVGGQAAYALCYLGNGIVILGTQDRHLWRSTDYGLTWTDLGLAFSYRLIEAFNIGNGVAIAGDYAGFGTAAHIYRTVDWGITWADLGLLSAGYCMYGGAYLGAGVAVIKCWNNSYIFRSLDYGAIWTAVGGIGTPGLTTYGLTHCGNGKLVTRTFGGEIYCSAPAQLAWP